MPNQRLIAILTALTYFGVPGGAHAAYSIEQLREIEVLIDARNCSGLRGYLSQNPGIMEGPDPLAEELRKFASDVDSGLIGCLAAPAQPAPAEVVAGAAPY